MAQIIPELLSLPAGADPGTFVANGDGTVSYRALGAQSVRIPASYFSGGMYQKDMAQYGRVMGPDGIFQAGSTYQPGSAGAFTGDATGGADQALYMQNDQGQAIGYSAPEQARRDAIDKAYQALASGSGGTTSFDVPWQPPQQLGSDVFSSLASGGLWMPAGSDVSARNQNIEARIGQNGEIVVRDPRGGDGQNPVYIYDQNGNYLRSEVGSKVMSPAMGVGMVALSALGGALAAGGGAGAGAAAAGADAGAAGAGAGVTGLGAGADLGAFYGGLDGAATLGGGASVAGGSALGALGGAGAGVSGLAAGSDLDALYGGLDQGATLGGGSSINGGSALGTAAGGVSSAASSLGSKAADALIKGGVSAGASALLGGSGSTGATTDLAADEAARQKKLQDAVDAINAQFGYGDSDAAKAAKTSRDSMYSDISGAVRDTALRDLDKQFTTASNRNTFGLARSGLVGGSVDAESGGDLQTRYGEGQLKATQAGQQSASDLRSTDESSRQNLISMAQAGLDTGTASSLAAGQMSAAADSAKSSATGATVGRLFDDMTQAYAQNQVLQSRYPTGLPSTTGYSNSLFGTKKYTGNLQG